VTLNLFDRRPPRRRRPPIVRASFDSEIIVDSFAGGGGASTGIEAAIGRPVDIAINHDAEAIAQHAINHPETRHYVEDVWKVDPLEACQGRPVGLAWFSPDCTHFSRAKGGTPVRKEIRGLAWVVIRWAQAVRPRVICLENVEELETWGPLVGDRPCPARKGETFRYWVAKLRSLGYAVEWQSLVAADYGAPTTRKRLYLVARCDDQPIVWPDRTHGQGREPWRTAAECIQWEIPCPSIFERKRPLADATLRRVAAGVRKYVLEAARPFVVSMRGTDPSHLHGDDIDAPLRTVSAGGTHHALASPTLIQTGYGERPGQAPRVPGLEKPLGTLVNGGKHALVAAFIARHFGGMVGAEIARPLHTVTSQDHHSLVTATLGERVARVRAFLTTYYGTGVGQDARDPLRTVTSHDRFGLVTVDGRDYEIADIGLRMLAPRELYRAQGFPDSYVIDRGPAGALTKTAQIRLVGNSVAPPVAEAIVRANYGRQSREVAA
jgi:DNA (cytosine-5)-methyltransferase 1